jgi:hypothetical protein
LLRTLDSATCKVSPMLSPSYFLLLFAWESHILGHLLVFTPRSTRRVPVHIDEAKCLRVTLSLSPFEPPRHSQVTLDEVATLKQMRRDPNCFLPGGAVGVVRPRTVSGELITDPEATKHNTIKLEGLGDKLEDDIANLAKQRMTFYVLPFEQYRDEVLREIDQKLKALLRLSKVMTWTSAVGANISDWK